MTPAIGAIIKANGMNAEVIRVIGTWRTSRTERLDRDGKPLNRRSGWIVNLLLFDATVKRHVKIIRDSGGWKAR